jgi:hypothetical protein
VLTRNAWRLEVSDGVGGGVKPPIVSEGLCACLHGAERGHGQIRIAHHLLERWAVQRASAGAARGEQH